MHEKNQGRSGRSPVVTGDGDKVEEVRESVCETPQTSTRHRSQARQVVPLTSLWCPRQAHGASDWCPCKAGGGPDKYVVSLGSSVVPLLGLWCPWPQGRGHNPCAPLDLPLDIALESWLLGFWPYWGLGQFTLINENHLQPFTQMKP